MEGFDFWGGYFIYVNVLDVMTNIHLYSPLLIDNFSVKISLYGLSDFPLTMASHIITYLYVMMDKIYTLFG